MISKPHSAISGRKPAISEHGRVYSRTSQEREWPRDPFGMAAIGIDLHRLADCSREMYRVALKLGDEVVGTDRRRVEDTGYRIAFFG